MYGACVARQKITIHLYILLEKTDEEIQNSAPDKGSGMDKQNHVPEDKDELYAAGSSVNIQNRFWMLVRREGRNLNIHPTSWFLFLVA